MNCLQKTFELLAKKCNLADKERSRDGLNLDSFSLQFEFFNFKKELQSATRSLLLACKKTIKRDPKMALTFEGGSAARLENGRSLRNFEEVVVALLLAIVTRGI